MKDDEIIGMLKTYIKATLVGMGALKGANCRIASIEKSGDTNTVTFAWTDTDGTSKTSKMEVVDGTDGVGIVSIEKTSTSGLVDTYTITLSNGDTETFTVTNGSGGSGGNLDDLDDVTITNISSGQVIVWDAVNSKWINQTLTADKIGLATALTINGESKTTTEAAISALAGLVDHITDSEYNSIASVLE